VPSYVTGSANFLQHVQAHITKVNGVKYMFGVEVPNGVKHALLLDKANGNNKWCESIDKELLQLNQYKTFQ
jgi:hypothetical protein